MICMYPCTDKSKIKTASWVITATSPPKVAWKEPRRHPSRQRMDSPAAWTSCTMPTADESNHWAAGALHPHHTDGHMTTAYRANIATSCDKKYTKFELGRHIQKKSSSESYHPSATKEICEWVRSHPLSKEWTRPLRVLLAAQCPRQTNPIT